MKALIDGDILPYEMGGLTKKEPEPDQEDIAPDVEVGELLPFEICWGAVQSKIERMLEAVNADEYCIFLSSPEIQTWRMESATIKPYKGHREDKEKPYHWDAIRTNLSLHYPSNVVEFMEADDAMAIEQYGDYYGAQVAQANAKLAHMDGPLSDFTSTVICSRDKDLNMVPGWHYSWPTSNSPEKPLWFQDEIGGLREFYTQLLTGDTVDNVLGLFGVGPKAACVKRVQGMGTEREMFDECFARYSERFGSYAKQFMLENGQLLWMQRSAEDRWNPWTDGRVDQWKEEEINESKES